MSCGLGTYTLLESSSVPGEYILRGVPHALQKSTSAVLRPPGGIIISVRDDIAAIFDPGALHTPTDPIALAIWVSCTVSAT